MRRLCILIADESVDAADALGTLCEGFGHEVDFAYEGAFALEAARQLVPDVIFLEVALPRLNGLQVARELRSHAFSSARFSSPWGRRTRSGSRATRASMRSFASRRMHRRSRSCSAACFTRKPAGRAGGGAGRYRAIRARNARTLQAIDRGIEVGTHDVQTAEHHASIAALEHRAAAPERAHGELRITQAPRRLARVNDRCGGKRGRHCIERLVADSSSRTPASRA